MTDEQPGSRAARDADSTAERPVVVPAEPATDEAQAPPVTTDPAPVRDDELSARLQARTEELFGTGAIDIIPGAPAPEAVWAPPAPVRKGLGGSALAFSIAALGGSFVVAWMFPVGILALVLGIIAVRRAEESTTFGRWAIGLSLLSLVYSAGWAAWVGFSLGWWG